MRRISVSKSPTFTGQVREVFHQATPTQGRRLAAHLVERLPTCPIPEIARLGRTLRKWKDALDAYFDTAGASNGPTEAINGIIELGRRTARGYRNPTNYQPRMLLIAGGLDASTHTQLSRAPKVPNALANQLCRYVGSDQSEVDLLGQLREAGYLFQK